MEAKTLDLVCLLSEQKQNIWFGPKMFLSQANRFHFGLRILGQSKAIRFGLEIVLGKIERF